MLNVSLSPSFASAIALTRASEGANKLLMAVMVAGLQAQAEHEIKTSLNDFIYDTELPERSERTYTTYNSVQREPVRITGEGVTGKVKLDRKFFSGRNYYPFFLDRGTRNMPKRPFFISATKVMRAEAKQYGIECARSMLSRLKAR